MRCAICEKWSDAPDGAEEQESLMADLEVQIGARSYRVACENGQEEHLRAVADRLRQEAALLTAQFGALSETRLLLMAGLLVVDRLRALEGRAGEAAALAETLAGVRSDLVDAAARGEALSAGEAEASAEAARLRVEVERALAARARAQDELESARLRSAVPNPADELARDAAAQAIARAAALEDEVAGLRAAMAELEAEAEAAKAAAEAAADAAGEDFADAAERAALRDRAAAAEHRNAVLSDHLEAAEGAAAESARALEEATRRIRVLIGDIEDGEAA
jgi:cell division protein ZapA